MDKDVFVFIGGCVAGLLAWFTIVLFRNQIRKGGQVRKSIFVTALTSLMAICGLVIGIITNGFGLLAIILMLSLGLIGTIISLIVGMVLYRSK